jgi:hypothetical protein
MSRLHLDSATGSIDLAWLLVILFFVTTVIAMRPEVAGVEPATSARGRAVVVSLDVTGEAKLVDGGGRALAGSVAGWMPALCAGEAPAVELRCHDEMTHRDCKQAVGALVSSAPGCGFRY